MAYRRQERFLQVARLCLAAPITHVEHPLPAASRRVDAICAPASEPSPFWGAEGELLAARALLLEPFGAPPRGTEVIGAMHKLVMATELWAKKKAGPFYPSEKGPALVIACPGRPEMVLHLLPDLETLEPGVWRTIEKPAFVVVVYDLRAIASTPGRSALAMTHWPETREDEERRVRTLRDDPGLPRSLKQRLVEAIMNRQVEVSDGEKKTAYELAVELGVRKGMRLGRERWTEKGRERGREEGREEGVLFASKAILEEAARFLPPEAVQRLARVRPTDPKPPPRRTASRPRRRTRD